MDERGGPAVVYTALQTLTPSSSSTAGSHIGESPLTTTGGGCSVDRLSSYPSAGSDTVHERRSAVDGGYEC